MVKYILKVKKGNSIKTWWKIVSICPHIRSLPDINSGPEIRRIFKVRAVWKPYIFLTGPDTLISRKKVHRKVGNSYAQSGRALPHMSPYGPICPHLSPYVPISSDGPALILAFEFRFMGNGSWERTERSDRQSCEPTSFLHWTQWGHCAVWLCTIWRKIFWNRIAFIPSFHDLQVSFLFSLFAKKENGEICCEIVRVQNFRMQLYNNFEPIISCFAFFHKSQNIFI